MVCIVRYYLLLWAWCGPWRGEEGCSTQWLLVVASVFCAFMANTARVFLIVLAAAKWNMDLSASWQHEVLACGLVGLGFLLLLSADELLLAMLAPIVHPEPEE